MGSRNFFGCQLGTSNFDRPQMHEWEIPCSDGFTGQAKASAHVFLDFGNTPIFVIALASCLRTCRCLSQSSRTSSAKSPGCCPSLEAFSPVRPRSRRHGSRLAPGSRRVTGGAGAWHRPARKPAPALCHSATDRQWQPWRPSLLSCFLSLSFWAWEGMMIPFRCLSLVSGIWSGGGAGMAAASGMPHVAAFAPRKDRSVRRKEATKGRPQFC